MLPADYIIREAKLDESFIIATLLKEQFNEREYLYTTLLAKHKEEIDQDADSNKDVDVQKYVASLANSHCFTAIHQDTQKIVGVVIVDIKERQTNTPIDAETNISPAKTKPCTTAKSRLLSEFSICVLKKANNTVNFFEKFPSIASALYLTMLCVHENHCRKGIATALIKEVVEFGRKRDIGLVYGLFTSHFSQRSAEKNGFKSYADMDILSFRDLKGNLVYGGMESHIISLMAVVFVKE